MIKELLSDLINKISTVSDLGNRVGAVVGGTATDPTMSEAPVPFCWVIFGGSNFDGVEQDKGQSYQLMTYVYVAEVILEYGSAEADFLSDSIDLLEAIPAAVRGKSSVANCKNWEFDGCELKSILADRIVYQLNFSVTGYNKTV